MRYGICLLFNINIDADSVDLDQTAPLRLLLKEQSDLHLHCLFTRLQKCSANNKNIQLFVIGALKVNA